MSALPRYPEQAHTARVSSLERQVDRLFELGETGRGFRNGHITFVSLY